MERSISFIVNTLIHRTTIHKILYCLIIIIIIIIITLFSEGYFEVLHIHIYT